MKFKHLINEIVIARTKFITKLSHNIFNYHLFCNRNLDILLPHRSTNPMVIKDFADGEESPSHKPNNRQRRKPNIMFMGFCRFGWQRRRIFKAYGVRNQLVVKDWWAFNP